MSAGVDDLDARSSDKRVDTQLSLDRDTLVIERFNSLWIQDANGCHIWQGGTDHRYGRFWDTTQQRQIRAHRWIYAHVHGPIPDGLWVLHSCDNPPCVNIDHLRLGTHDDNMADLVERGRHWETRLTHCKHGHEWTPENTIIRPNKGRWCRACDNRRKREFRRRQRENANG